MPRRPRSQALLCPAGLRPRRKALAWLLKNLGAEKFARFQKAFGGRRLWVPKSGARPSCANCDIRDECIRIWRKEGRNIPAIAAFLGISRQSVYRILARPARQAGT